MTTTKLEPGLKGQQQTLVCEHNVAGHVDKFSTPSMIGLMERAAIAAVQECLEEGANLGGIRGQRPAPGPGRHWRHHHRPRRTHWR